MSIVNVARATISRPLEALGGAASLFGAAVLDTYAKIIWTIPAKIEGVRGPSYDLTRSVLNDLEKSFVNPYSR